MIRRTALFVAVFAIALTGIGASGAFATSPKKEVLHASDMHVYPARGNAAPTGKGPNPLLTYHGGPVQHGTTVKAIFWGTSWGNSSFVGDKISGLDTFYGGVGSSGYAATNTEYTDGNGHVSTGVTYGNYVVDTSAAPSKAPATSAVLAEVANMIDSPVAGGYYPVYVDTRRGTAGYCAWHSAGTIGTTPVEFGFFFNLDGDSGCDPKDTATTHSQGLEALANVTGHEFSETVTDPKLNAWYDRSGAENSDKCAWTFSGTRLSIGGSLWRVQGNFSNAAYNARSGYDGAGCIDGH